MPEKTTDSIPGWQSGSGQGARDLGNDLRARREELGWALPDVANWLRIRETYLLALEEGDTGVFPGSAYALGFLRSYAHALGMDPDHAVARFRQDTRGALDRKPELSFPEPVSERGVPVGLWVGAGLAVLVGTYIGYYHFFGADPAPTHQMPPVAEIMPGVTQHGTPSPQIAAVMPDRGLAPSPQTAPAPVQGTTPPLPSTEGVEPTRNQPVSPASTGVTGAGNGATLPSSGQTDQAALSPPAVTPQPETAQSSLPTTTRPEPPGANSTATETPPVSPAAANMIVLHAAADAWVSIRDKTGAIVLSRVLKAGETWQGAEDAGPYRMTLGNAGGLSLSAGDVTTAALGRVGAVRRGLVVTAEAIRNGQLGQETGVASPAVPAAALAPGREAVSPDTGSGQNASPTLKKLPIVPKMTTTEHESETDRLNARQLEQTAQPR